jgi:hypothetical protein
VGQRRIQGWSLELGIAPTDATDEEDETEEPKTTLRIKTREQRKAKTQ